MFELTEQDKKQLNDIGISEKKFYEQLSLISTGVPYINLIKPCTVGDGIKVLTLQELDEHITLYERSLNNIKPVKFVPASGAASRMFSLLDRIKLDYDSFIKRVESNTANEDDEDFLELIDRIEEFAFFEDLKQAIAKSGKSIEQLKKEKDYETIIDYLLSENGLDYSNCPKGLIKFHKYGHYSRTAFEEHLVEALNYTTSNYSVSRLHFTILQDHKNKVKKYIDSVMDNYVIADSKFMIDYSFQSPQTDIIAVDFDNLPLRDDKQRLIFRPGGHGALLRNLNSLTHDIIFIKNIDNVVPDRLKDVTYKYKKALAGLLIKIKSVSDNYLNMIEDNTISQEVLNAALEFVSHDLDIDIKETVDESDFEKQKVYLFDCLNRPLRICGVVKNVGEPGGGPFWVSDSDGKISRQIVESAQVDMSSPDQSRKWESSTHFNPVDLVCSVYDYKGDKFDLEKFVDFNTVFITKKSKNGIDIKSMELPGLWNGSMARWNTVFVEVPQITFNPVKTVMDLLKKEHLPET